MPVFNVVICRETVDEVAVRIEAPTKEDITSECLNSMICEGVHKIRKIADWYIVENSLNLDVNRVGEVDCPPELILKRCTRKPPSDPWRVVTAPKRPEVDPRQTNLPIEEKT